MNPEDNRSEQRPVEPSVPPSSGSEPIFKIPFVPLVVAVGLLGLFMVQPDLTQGGTELGLRPVDLSYRYMGGLFTHMLVHGSWAHVIMNAVALLAFGAPVARDFDKGMGPIGWLLFFIVCGVLGGLGYALVHWGDYTPMVGASGAVFGMIGASLRLMAGPGLLIPMFHPVVLRGAAAWMVVNLVTGLLGSVLTGGEAGIAWEAHAFGFLAGIILIAPFHQLFSRKIHRMPMR